jgi:hypothetical protein
MQIGPNKSVSAVAIQRINAVDGKVNILATAIAERFEKQDQRITNLEMREQSDKVARIAASHAALTTGIVMGGCAIGSAMIELGAAATTSTIATAAAPALAGAAIFTGAAYGIAYGVSRVARVIQHE